MGETKDNKAKFFDNTYAVLTVIFMIAGIVSSVLLLRFLNGREGNKTVLDTGWKVTRAGVTIEDVDLKEYSFEDVKAGETVVLETVLEGDFPEIACMKVNVHYHDVLVEMDGEEIFSADRDRFDRGEMLGSGFYIAELGRDCAGKKIKITIRAGEDKAFGSIECPQIWDSVTFRQDYASDRIYPLALAFFFIVLGISMAVMAVIVGIRRTFSAGDTFRLCSLSLFSIAVGAYMLGELDLMEIITNDTVRIAEIKYYALFVIPVFFIGFQFEESVDKKDRIKNTIFGCAWLIVLFFCIYAFIMHNAFGVNPRRYLTFSQVLNVACVLAVLVIRIREMLKGRNRYRMSVYMTIAAGGAAILALIRYLIASKVFGNAENSISINYLYIVFLFFVLSLFFDYMTNAIESAKQKERMAVMAKLAFSDPLTGLNNRQAAEQYYDRIDKSEEPFIVTWFDLNDLKKTNDTYGHDAGDKYIQLFADVLRETFEGKGFIARTGGDEFVYVINKKDDDDIIKLFEQLGGLNEQLANIDTEFMDLKMNVSYGIYDSVENEANNIREALRIADTRMYEMKKSMRADRS